MPGDTEQKSLAMDDSPPLSTDSTDRAIRVFLLDDHEVVRRGIADVLEADGITIVGEAATAARVAPQFAEVLRRGGLAPAARSMLLATYKTGH